MTKRTITATALILGLSLTACAYDGEEGEPAEQPEESAPAEEQTPEETESEQEAQEEGEEGEGTEEEEAEDDEQSSEHLRGLVHDHLIPEDGTTYARAEQAFSPRFSIWTLNGDRMEVVQHNCAGGVIDEGSGHFDGQRVHWDDDENPVRGQRGPNTRVNVDDAEITGSGIGLDPISAEVDEEIDAWVDMCRATGEFLVDVAT